MDKSRKIRPYIFINENKEISCINSIYRLTCFLSLNTIKTCVIISVLLLSIVCISVKTWAQGEDEQTGYFLAKQQLFYAGLIGGMNFAQVDGDKYAGYYKFGLNVGGIGYIRLFKRVSLSYEILFSQKGSKSDVPTQSGIDSIIIKNYEINVNYAEIPIMINVFDKLKSHIGIGISYNKLVNSSEVLDLNKHYAIDLNKYQFRSDEWEFIAGAQLHLVKGLFVGLRFQYSLTPIRTDTPPYFSRPQNNGWAQQYNNLWTIRLMYLFM